MAHTSEPSVETPSESTTPKGRGNTWLWWAVFIIVIGGSWLWYQTQWDARIREEKPTHKTATVKSLTPPKAPAANPTAKLEKQLSSLSKSMERAFTQMETISQRVDQLNAKLDEKPTAPAPEAAPIPPAINTVALMGLQDKLDTLSTQLNAVKAQQEQAAANHKQILKSLKHLQVLESRLQTGEPFADVLKQLQETQDSDTLNVLEAQAENGIATLTELNQAFRQSANMAIPAALGAKQNPSITDRMRARVGHVISIRKTTVDMGDTSDEANLARAEALLTAGDVQGALAQIQLTSTKTRLLLTDVTLKMQAYHQSWQAYKDFETQLLTTSSEGQV